MSTKQTAVESERRVILLKSSEIASLAGVSRSTVSRVVNNHGSVDQETRQRVKAIIEQYDYEPNTQARALVGKPNNTVGLFIVGLPSSNVPNRIYQSGYFAPFVEIIADAVSSHGCFTLIALMNCPEDYDIIRQAFLQKRISRGIILGTRAAEDIYGKVLDKGYPLAIIDMDPEECRKFRGGQANLTIVNAMNYEGTFEAIEYLHGLGHTEIGFLAGAMNTYSGRERYRAYRDVMRRLGLAVREEFIIQGNFMGDVVKKELRPLLTAGSLPTAFFSSNDDMALAAIEVFKAEGIRVPQDISVIGFDDILSASLTSPALTTVRVPMVEMARKAADAMIHAIDNKDRSQAVYNLPTTLVIRESCAGRSGPCLD